MKNNMNMKKPFTAITATGHALIIFSLLSAFSTVATPTLAGSSLTSSSLTIRCEETDGNSPAEGDNAPPYNYNRKYTPAEKAQQKKAEDESTFLHMKITELTISQSTGLITLRYTTKSIKGAPLEGYNTDKDGNSVRTYRIDKFLAENGRNITPGSLVGGKVKVSKISGIEIDENGKDKAGSEAGLISIPRYGNYVESDLEQDNYGGGVIINFGMFSIKGILKCEEFIIEENASSSSANQLNRACSEGLAK